MSRIVLNQSDRDILQRAINIVQQLNQNNPVGQPENGAFNNDLHQAPEVYVAALPDGTLQIDGRDELTPGSAECEIYQLIPDGEGGYGLSMVGALTKTVYNLNTTAITQEFFPIHRDKFGKWFAGSGSGGTTTHMIRFRIVDRIFCGGCVADATIESRVFGTGDVPEEIYGRVTVVDRTGCKLNEPNDALYGREGYAVYMTARTEDGPCPGMELSSWEIVDMCCDEVLC